jgi:hypothetical protein
MLMDVILIIKLQMETPLERIVIIRTTNIFFQNLKNLLEFHNTRPQVKVQGTKKEENFQMLSINHIIMVLILNQSYSLTLFTLSSLNLSKHSHLFRRLSLRIAWSEKEATNLKESRSTIMLTCLQGIKTMINLCNSHKEINKTHK